MALRHLAGWRPPAEWHRRAGGLWARRVSRGAFLRGAAGAGAALAAAGAWRSAGATEQVDGAAPLPIPGTLQLLGPGTERFHVFFPTAGQEQASINDFDGLIGSLDVEGTGVGRNTATGETSPLVFTADMRVMDGSYVGADGMRRQGTFAFV